MPSPIAHGLAGIAAGWLVDRPWSLARTMVFGLAGAAPDVDLLFGVHRGPTHSLAAALMMGLVASALTRQSNVRWTSSVWLTADAAERVRFGLAVTAAYASHTLLDWLGTDTSAPVGVMALWPLTRDYYESTLHVFMATSRRYWLPEFWMHNLRALARELAILVPIAAVVYLLRRDTTEGSSRTDE